MRQVMTVLALAGLLTTVAVSGPSAAVASSAGASTARAGASVASAGVRAREHQPQVSYYLALGDSLSQGVQPDASGTSVMTRQGYADQLYAVLHRQQPGLRLVKLGCPGETTATMIHGGICSYQGGSQLAAAVSFLRAHRPRISLVTIDIGANDPGSCVAQPSVAKLATCIARAIPQAAANLPKIMSRLREAGPHVRIIAMNYYLPALAEWRNGLGGKALAHVSELATVTYNAVLTHIYQAYGARVADVFSAFHTADFTPQVAVPRLGTLPANVAAICRWTWECTAPPRGPNEHANQAGYQVIARTFLLAGAGSAAGG